MTSASSLIGRPEAAYEAWRLTGAGLAVAWALCLGPRLLATVALGHSPDYEAFIVGRPYTYWYPVYAGLARALWVVSGGHLLLYKALHAAVHALVGPAVYALAHGLRLPRHAAWLGVLGVAFLPYYVSAAARQPEPGFVIALFTVYMATFAQWARGGYRLGWGVAHAGLALLLFVERPNVLPVVGLLFLVGWLHARRHGQGARGGVVKGWLVFVALSVGLSLTVHAVTGRASLVPPNYGYNLYIGNNPYVPAYARADTFNSFEPIVWDHGLPGRWPTWQETPEQERELAQIALEYVRTHPGQTLENIVWKTIRYWDIRPGRMNEKSTLWMLLYTVPYLVYLPLALAGVVLLWRRGARFAAVVLGLAPLAYWLPHAVFFGAVRMRMTTEALLLLLAATAVALGIERWEERRGPSGVRQSFVDPQ